MSIQWHKTPPKCKPLYHWIHLVSVKPNAHFWSSSSNMNFVIFYSWTFLIKWDLVIGIKTSETQGRLYKRRTVIPLELLIAIKLRVLFVSFECGIPVSVLLEVRSPRLGLRFWFSSGFPKWLVSHSLFMHLFFASNTPNSLRDNRVSAINKLSNLC